eukprot:3441824-Lingulodinium_polyedra.AAC.1
MWRPGRCSDLVQRSGLAGFGDLAGPSDLVGLRASLGCWGPRAGPRGFCGHRGGYLYGEAGATPR